MLSADELEKRKQELLQDYRANRRTFWDIRVDELQQRWGGERGDFPLIQAALQRLRPTSLLEVGCGYGRYFPLYIGIPHVVGVDVSSTMLARAAQSHPSVILRCQAIEELNDPPDSFDVVVACRVLMHIPYELIAKVVQNMARVCRLGCIVLERSGGFQKLQYEFSHDYPRLSSEAGLVVAQDIELEDYGHFYVLLKRPAKDS